MTTTAAWTNWSGSVRCAPRQLAMPDDEAAIIALVRGLAREPGAELRAVGTGHSFAPLCATDGVLLSLDRLQGIIDVDPARMEATIWAGTELHRLGAPLLAAGLALENLGDIDRQSLGGAIGTGTHGTGQTLGSIPTQVVGLRLVLASGEILDCSAEREPEIFAAARLSLGALGVITRVTLRLLPAYRLHERTWAASFAECLAGLAALIEGNRHFEFFWSPREDACAMKALNPTTAVTPESPAPPPAAPGRLARYLGPERVDWSYRIFPSERTVRFNELEFAVPAANGPACLRELRSLMQGRHPEVAWPIEYRTLRADDIPLSPAYGRETVTISLHQAHDRPHERFFADAEAIFRNHQGRPHWGKMHRYDVHDLRAAYPGWDQFHAVRQRLDPDGRWLNPYLRCLFLQ